jgi:hypothetical protein
MGEYITIGLTVVGVIVWGIRLEGRVNTLQALREQSSADLEKLLDVKFQGIVERLTRIENKQDRAANGNGKAYS